MPLEEWAAQHGGARVAIPEMALLERFDQERCSKGGEPILVGAQPQLQLAVGVPLDGLPLPLLVCALAACGAIELDAAIPAWPPVSRAGGGAGSRQNSLDERPGQEARGLQQGR